MSLYRRGNVWWSRIEVNKRVYQFSCKTANKNTARSVEALFRTERLKGVTGLSVPTLYEFSTDFINKGVVGRVSKQTFKYYVAHFEALYNSKLCDMRLDRIDQNAIAEFVMWRRKQGVTVTTINHSLRTLRRMFSFALEWNVLAKIPKVKMLPGERQREFVLSREEVKRFESLTDPIGRIVPFLVDTGLRRGEVCRLTWRDVGTVEILITRGKTRFARRRIPLTKRAVEILKGLPRNGENVFVDRYGHAITPDWLTHAFVKARRALGISEQAVLHSTRHTFCTRLGESGADAFAIQRLAGHSSITISQKYVHTSAARLDAVIAELN